MTEPHWTEDNSRAFLEYGRFFVPDREEQIAAIAALIPAGGAPAVLELGCGAGLLARAVLERHPGATVLGLDGSAAMRDHAAAALAPFGARFQTGHFELAAADWRAPGRRFDAIVSSLVVHHLDDAGKQQLFGDLRELLNPGGALVLADVVSPASQRGVELAAAAYDEIVRRRARELEGDETAFRWFEQERWNLFSYPDDPIDTPSRLFSQLKWLEQAGFVDVDVFWMRAGHAIYGGSIAPRSII